jgi:hypothetical protein
MARQVMSHDPINRFDAEDLRLLRLFRMPPGCCQTNLPSRGLPNF